MNFCHRNLIALRHETKCCFLTTHETLAMVTMVIAKEEDDDDDNEGREGFVYLRSLF